jgi:hypothetical protein
MIMSDPAYKPPLVDRTEIALLLFAAFLVILGLHYHAF